MRVLFLGSGLLGVSSAWYLSQLGHEVTVVDRQACPAAETSHANGGQISVSHAEPWANPSAPFKVLKWLTNEDAPLLFRLRADPRQWAWGLRFLRECTPARTRHNIRQIVSLGTYSRSMLRQLRADTGIAYDHRTQSILHFYTSQQEFEGALEPTRQMRELGCERLVMSADGAVRLEPALRTVRSQLAGATFTAEDESGDARKFTLELAKRCEARGVKFLMSHHITRLVKEGDTVSHVEVTAPEGRYQRLSADSYVLAAGSFSALLAAPLGLNLPIYPAKGYSVTLPVVDASRAYETSLTPPAQPGALPGDRAARAATVPRRSRREPCPILGWTAPRHAVEPATDWPQQNQQSVPQYRPRHPGLDACLRLGQGAGRHCEWACA